MIGTSLFSRHRGGAPDSQRRFQMVAAIALASFFAGFACAQDASRVLQPEALQPAQREAKDAGLLSGSYMVAYWYGSNYRTPFVVNSGGKAADIARNAVEFTHTAIWSMGSNMADVLVNQSSAAEPAASGGAGATEIYATLRSSVGLNELTRSYAFHLGPVRDVAMEVGANLETKNSSYAPAERTIYIGPKIQLALPRGYFDIGIHFRKEWNHEGVLGKSESYDPNFNIEPAWLLPFQVGKVHLVYTGFADYNTAKGTDSFGSATAPEFLARNYISLDIGGLMLGRTHLLDLNGGFWYWHNEYGKPSSDPGARQMTPMFGMAFHLDGLWAHRE